MTVLATFRKDGERPAVAPLSRMVGRRVQRVDHRRGCKGPAPPAHPRATIVVAESADPYRGVEIRGVAELIDQDVFEVATRIMARYLVTRTGPLREGLPGTHLIARLEPGNLRVWDFADE